MKFYLLSGLGADHRIFTHFEVPGISTEVMEWLAPEKNESIASYAKRLLDQIEETGPVNLLGVSFGGMIAQEIAKQVPCQQLILISSVKSRAEYSLPLRMLSRIRIDKIIPANWLKYGGILLGPFFFSTKSRAERKLLRAIMKDTDVGFLRWAINQIMEWEGTTPSAQQVLHIHGSGDRIFPTNLLSHYKEVRGGGHFMIVNRMKEITQLIESEIGLPPVV